MARVTSKIKSMFPSDLLKYIAAICDNRRISSNNEKMTILCNLLNSYDVNFEILGGATNRIVLQIGGYAVKFAMDDQGYLDNLIEYSLSPELQPFVTKSYETNGYIQVQETVEVMNKEMFRMYNYEIIKVLETICQDYLLGDVGIIEKNRTNWGIRDGKPVILDYAYCHRATDNLFTCGKCGKPLTYDSSFDKLICVDRSSCKTIYTYNERKRIQGNQVDIDMIKERKEDSIRLDGDIKFKDIEMVDDRLISDKYFVIDCPEDAYRYEQLKEERSMKVFMNVEDEIASMEERFAAMVDLALDPNDAKARAILDAASKVDERPIPEPLYTDRYQDEFMYAERIHVPEQFKKPAKGFYDDFGDYYDLDDDEDEEEDEDFDCNAALERMIDMSLERRRKVQEDFETCAANQLNEYLNSRNENSEPVEEVSEDNEELIVEETIIEDTGMKTIEVTAEKEPDCKDEKTLRDIHEEVIIEDPVEQETSSVEEINPIVVAEDISIPVDVFMREEVYNPVTYDDVNSEDAAVIVNGKPLPIGEEVFI